MSLLLFEYQTAHHCLAIRVQEHYGLCYRGTDQGNDIGYGWRRTYYERGQASAHDWLTLTHEFNGDLKITEYDHTELGMEALKLFGFDIGNQPPYRLLNGLRSTFTLYPLYFRSYGYETLTGTRFLLGMVNEGDAVLAKLAYDTLKP